MHVRGVASLNPISYLRLQHVAVSFSCWGLFYMQVGSARKLVWRAWFCKHVLSPALRRCSMIFSLGRPSNGGSNTQDIAREKQFRGGGLVLIRMVLKWKSLGLYNTSTCLLETISIYGGCCYL